MFFKFRQRRKVFRIIKRFLKNHEDWNGPSPEDYEIHKLVVDVFYVKYEEKMEAQVKELVGDKAEDLAHEAFDKLTKKAAEVYTAEYFQELMKDRCKELVADKIKGCYY